MTRSTARPQPTPRHGMLIFGLIWLGQVVSLVGSGLTEFGLGVWVFQRTGAATDYALIALCISLPQVLVAPLAGTVVDRADRRLVMLLSDCGAALSTLVVASLAWSGSLETWHVYAAVLATSTCAAVQYPAYAALMTQLVPPERLGRANGMVEMAWSGSFIVAPLLAATLIQTISLPGLLLVDLLTFVVGVATLLMARIPGGAMAPVASEEDSEGFVAQARAGWVAIAARPGLMGLLLLSAVVSLGAGTFNALFAPMILSTESAGVLGQLASVGGVGMLAGGLVLTAWGGPQRKLYGVLGASLVLGLAMLAIGAKPSALLLAAATGLYFACLPILNGCEQTIWQTSMPAGLQGRALSVRRAVEHGAAMLAYLVAGPIADRLAEPLLAPGGALAPTVGTILGTGPGRGIGLLLVVMGLVTMGAIVWGSLSARIRRVEDERPLADQIATARVLEPAA